MSGRNGPPGRAACRGPKLNSRNELTNLPTPACGQLRSLCAAAARGVFGIRQRPETAAGLQEGGGGSSPRYHTPQTNREDFSGFGNVTFGFAEAVTRGCEHGKTVNVAPRMSSAGARHQVPTGSRLIAATGSTIKSKSDGRGGGRKQAGSKSLPAAPAWAATIL